MNNTTQRKQAHPAIWFGLAFALLGGAYAAAQLFEEPVSARVRKPKPKEMYAKVTNDEHVDDSELESEADDRPLLVPIVEDYSDADRAELNRIIEGG